MLYKTITYRKTKVSENGENESLEITVALDDWEDPIISTLQLKKRVSTLLVEPPSREPPVEVDGDTEQKVEQLESRIKELEQWQHCLETDQLEKNDRGE